VNNSCLGHQRRRFAHRRRAHFRENHSSRSSSLREGCSDPGRAQSRRDSGTDRRRHRSWRCRAGRLGMARMSGRRSRQRCPPRRWRRIDADQPGTRSPRRRLDPLPGQHPGQRHLSGGRRQMALPRPPRPLPWPVAVRPWAGRTSMKRAEERRAGTPGSAGVMRPWGGSLTPGQRPSARVDTGFSRLGGGQALEARSCHLHLLAALRGTGAA
jgi:hypothetical protein